MKIEEMIAGKRSDCAGCEACANVCPKRAIEMTPDAEGFFYPKIDKARCIECGQCDQVCPALNFKELPLTRLPAAAAAVNPDWNVRRKSSSGGVFGALAEHIFKRGGIVFGARFNSDWEVVHSTAESIEELAPMRGSKYVQSRIGETYARAKRELESGREVLFSGTPCQIAGLKYFLRHKDYPKLTLVDIICHGVTPPVLWKHYIGYRGLGHSIADVKFRDKQFGWETPLFKIIFKDRGQYSTDFGRDLFGQGFGLGLTLRPSCSECRFKGVVRFGDLTLADFWGVRSVEPTLFDNRGTSLVLVHNEKGVRLINEATLLRKPINLRQAIEFNPCSLVSFPADPRRAEFFAELSKADPIAVLEKYWLQDFSEQAKQRHSLMTQFLHREIEAITQQLIRASTPQPPPPPQPSPPTTPKENVLIVTLPQEWKGGSVVFVKQYITRYLSNANIFLLQPIVIGGIARLTLYDRQSNKKYVFDKSAEMLNRLLNRFSITSIFINHLISHDLNFIMNWIVNSKLPYTFFIHDYFCVCPNHSLECITSFCSSNTTNPYCRKWFEKAGMPGVSAEQWRTAFGKFLSGAKSVVAPTNYAANIVKRFYPSINVESRPHYLELPLRRTFEPRFAEREKLRVLFLGNMLRKKGEYYLLLANEFIRSTGLPIEFVVLGHFQEDVFVGSKEGIIFAGRYDNREVSNLLARYETALVAQLSPVYETYSYTSSEAILSGYPVLALNIGAHSARIVRHDCGWILPLGSPSRGLDEFKKFLQFIVTPSGRRNILLKANNTARFQNGME